MDSQSNVRSFDRGRETPRCNAARDIWYGAVSGNSLAALMSSSAAEIIAELRLEPLPDEGGYFRQQWISDARQLDGRPVGSLIWFLVTPEGFSALHRVDADERWVFHRGDIVEHVQLDAATRASVVTSLGHPDIPQTAQSLRVPAGMWQGARLSPSHSPRHGWALISCLMTPAWSETGFTLGGRELLLEQFPSASASILALTR